MISIYNYVNEKLTLCHYVNEKLTLNNQSKLQKKWSIEDAKEGDIIMVSADNEDMHKIIFIFKCIFKSDWDEEGDVVGLYAYYNYNDDRIEILDEDNESHIGEVDNYINGTYKNRLATDEEKKLFFNKLNKQGFRWNENKKEIEKIKK